MFAFNVNLLNCTVVFCWAAKGVPTCAASKNLFHCFAVFKQSNKFLYVLYKQWLHLTSVLKVSNNLFPIIPLLEKFHPCPFRELPVSWMRNWTQHLYQWIFIPRFISIDFFTLQWYKLVQVHPYPFQELASNRKLSQQS